MNKDRIIASIIAIGSGVCGFLLGCTFAKKRYYEIADKEVASVKEKLSKDYERRLAKVKNNEKEAKAPESKTEANKENDKDKETIKSQYHDYSKPYSSGTLDENENKPYLLDSEEDAFSLSDDIIPYTYYSDKILADNDFNVISDVESTVGQSNLTGITEDNPSVYICNPKTGKVYEVIYDERTFSQALSGFKGHGGGYGEVYEEDD